LLLPIIPETLDTITVWRERYQTGIAALMDTPGTLEEPGTNVNSSSFYLSYNNYNNRTVMEALCRLFRQILPDSTATSPHITEWSPPATREQRIRVGFLSEFLVNHTIGRLYQGFIRHLDRNRFEVMVIHTPKAKRDSFSHSLDALADKVLTLPTRLKDQQQTIMAEKLDVLFYPDIGMAPSTYFLAYTRLAPVQAVGWGHPDTTGLDSIDYFVSAVTIEPENAEEYYTERLVRLNRIPCYYQALMASAQIPNRLAMGLPETGTLYGCPQSLFKFHPDFDHVLATIAEGDPAGYIVLLEGKRSAWGELLKARWAKTFPILLERVLFIPRMPLERFTAFMSHMDILLDPIHFGSGNTLYEAMVYGIPVVTWPGQFMRGRIVAGAYRQMGIVDAPIALGLEDYAPLALALGRDQERRQALHQALLDASCQELFADTQAIQEFEIFLEAAVDAAGRGEKLSSGWRPNLTQQTQHKITVGAEPNLHISPEKMVKNNHCLPQKGAVEASQEDLSPALLAYHKNVLAMRQSSMIDYPAHVHLETMAKCNAACSFCPYSTLDRQGAVMEDELIEKVVNDLCDIPRLHTFQLSPFKVNEPFLDNRLIDLLALFNTRLPNACITLTSNASPITEKKLTQLAAFPRIGYLWISFNDHRKVEYEQTMQLPYKRTIERLEMIHKAKAEQRLHIRVVLSRVSDGSSTDREFAIWVKTRFPLFDVSLLPRGGWIGQINAPANPPPSVRCSRWFDVSITATGEVAHCCMDGKAEFPIGNVRHEHVLEIYNKPSFRRLREKLNTRLEVDPCRRCSFL
jgi:radical SAM protein with 4Fe4S-binding SPASM domain